jgi:DNA polymerase (family 10)
MLPRNATIAAAFDEMADLLELQQANPFRIRAYRNAARTLAVWPEEMSKRRQRQAPIDDLPGIGEDLAGKIEEMLDTGHMSALERLREEFPPGITALLQVPGLGPKRVQTLYHELGTYLPAQLLEAARVGRIQKIPGFGKVSEKRIAEAIAAHLERSTRWPLARVAADVENLLGYLRAIPGVATVVAAGSYRRRRDTVGDVDLLAVARSGRAAIDGLCSFEAAARVLSRGTTRAGIVLANGLQVDLRVVRPASFGAALVYFTGSKAHNIALRRMGQERGLKINEYGVYRGARRVAGTTEASVYAALDLPCIPPELRENQGEIEAARAHRLPHLIERTDLQGDLHAHTDASDGHESLARMAEAARAAGLRYLAITDHSRSLHVAHGLDARRLHQQIDAIERLNERLRGIVLLKGIEVDILPDGKLDLSDSVLARLDLVVCAVHSAFELTSTRQTERLLRAMDHRYFSILAHPNGRLLGTRGPYEFDFERVLAHARERGCFLELNAQPDRLDLFDTQCRQTKGAGVPVVISSDAHRGEDLRWLDAGIDQARRGWLEAGDVLNTLPLAQLRVKLAATMG